ncbi:hypothetical protein [Devosia sp.]|uniref:hypothetical protein n=1 Tax=Devosia sp. TaxID=1871048 RepID=UPI003A8F0ACD
MIRPALLTLSVLLAPTAAHAADELTTADHLAAMTLGVADGATVMVLGSEAATVERTAPGIYGGVVQTDGTAYDLTFVETDPCVFQATFAWQGEAFSIQFHPHNMQSVDFVSPQSAAEFTRYRVQLTGAPAMVLSQEDGEWVDAGDTSPIGTTLTLEQLEAAAQKVLEACPYSAETES